MLAGRSLASERSAGGSEWGVAAGQVQPRGHGNPQALHVHGGQHSWQDPAGGAPQAGAAHRGEALDFLHQCLSSPSGFAHKR